jgi:hypothetical protein
MNAYEEVAKELGLQPKFVTHILYGSGPRNNFYKEIQIPKKGGEVRIIHAVQGRMRMLQVMLYNSLKDRYKPSKYAMGFVSGKNIIENARIHRKNKVVIKFDVKDFFPSITFPRVRGMFMQHPFHFSKEKATVLAQICCLEKSGPIPQGGVTSPYISNMICRKLDARLAGLSIKYKMQYSRYADDMVFSSNYSDLNVVQAQKYIKQVVEDEGFQLNHKKTKVLRKNQPQSITGILVNEGLNVRRTYIRNIRATLYKCEKTSVLKQALEYYSRIHVRSLEFNKTDKLFHDIEGGTSYTAKTLKDSFLAHIAGRIHFYGFVARSNERLNESHYETRNNLYLKLLSRFKQICEREGIRYTHDHVEPYKAIEVFKNTPEVAKIVSSIRLMNDTDLNNFIKEMEFNDPRFFIDRVTIRNIEKRRTKAIELIERPLLDPEHTLNLFQYLHDSEAYVLGRLVHADNDTSRNQIQEFLGELMSLSPTLPDNLVKITKKLLLGADKKLEALKVDQYDFWADEKWRIEHIYKYKRQIRFHRANKDAGSVLVARLKSIADEIEGDKTFVISTDYLKDRGFYTDVEQFLRAVRYILRSMVISSKGDKIYIVSEQQPGKTVFCIHDDDVSNHFNEMPQRSQLAHGKIRAAIRRLYGLANYSVACKTQEEDWVRVDMLSGKKMDIEESVTFSGYTHRLEIPQVV